MHQRVNEQQVWYAKKSTFNKNAATKYFVALIISNSLAIIFAVVKINSPTFEYWPIDVLVTVAASILAWMQAKKYSEHASSYALAANEISLLKAGVDDIETENALSEFVLDAEKAFSREHTQWVARKDKNL
jgi:flagellar biosynthesis protein FliQ